MKLLAALAMAWAALAAESLNLRLPEPIAENHDEAAPGQPARAADDPPTTNQQQQQQQLAPCITSEDNSTIAEADDDLLADVEDINHLSGWGKLAVESTAHGPGNSPSPWTPGGGSSVPSPTEPGSPVEHDAEMEQQQESEPAAAGLQLQQQQLVACGVCCEDTIKKVLIDACSDMSQSMLHDDVLRHMAFLSNHHVETNCIRNLADDLFSNPHYRASSNANIAEKFDLDVRTLPEWLQILASSFVEVQRALRRLLEERAVTSISLRDLLAFIDVAAYDETPMPVVTTDLPNLAERQELVNSSSSLVSNRAGVVVVPELADNIQLKEKQCNNIFQSEQKHVILLRLRAADGKAAGYAVIRGDTINWLQRLANTGTLAVTAALQRTSAVSEFANSFLHRWRTACTDDAKANPAAEAQLLARRNKLKKGWKGWRMACEVHKAATCHTTAFMLLESTISGVLNCSLSVNFGNYVARFRRILFNVTRANIIFRTTPLDETAKTYKMHVLRVFCASGRKRSFKVTLLLRLLPGDWRNKSAVEYILQPGESAADAKEQVARGVSSALCSSKFFEYPRHRWTGADISVSQWGLMEAVHGLLSWTYPRFKASFDRHGRSKYDNVEPILPFASADDDHADGGDDEPMPHLIVCQAAEAPVGPQDLPQTQTAVAPGKSAEDNARFRS